MKPSVQLYFSILVIVLLTLGLSVFAQKTETTLDKEAAYTNVIHQRAAKIVTGLGLTDSIKAKRVTDIIAAQYKNLRDIHDARNTKVNALKADSTKSKAVKDSLVKTIEAERTAKLATLHNAYLSKLSKELTQEQTDKVKDGMTFGKVQFTFGGYLQMIPSLTDAHKKQIFDWLLEARELAMDAESSEKKTTIFGNYKGRIANYLSKEGYDLKKEQVEWNKRIKEANDSTKNK